MSDDEHDDNPLLLRAGLCSRGHTIAVKSDLIECPDGFRCRRCDAAARAERHSLRGRWG